MNELLARASRTESEGWLALGQVPGAAYRVERHGAVTAAWWCGTDGTMHNYIRIGAEYAGDLQSVVADLRERIAGSQSQTAIWLIGDDYSDRRLAEAAQLGYRVTSDIPVMACELRRPRPTVPIPPEVTIRRVAGDEEYRQAFEVVHAVYGGPRSLTRFFNPIEPVQLYAAYWDGTPAASSTTWPFASVAGIFSVATLPAFRRRGLALAVVQRQLADAAAEGVDLATLRTVDELVPFYGRLGFRVVGRAYQLIPKE